MAGESVDENIYLATTFGFGGQKRFTKPPLAIAERCGSLEKTFELVFIELEKELQRTTNRGIMKFELTSAEALVLFELVARTNKNERLTIEDKSEQIVLWNLESILEKKLTEPLHKNYQELLKAARAEVNAI